MWLPNSSVQSVSFKSALLLLQCKIITLVVNKHFCSRKQFLRRRICATKWRAVLRQGCLLSALQNIFTPLSTFLCTQSLSCDRKQPGDRRYSVSPRSKYYAFLFNASTMQSVSGTGRRLAAAHCLQVAHLCQTAGRLCRPHSLLLNKYRQ